VQRERRLGAVVAHAVDVLGVEREALAGRDDPRHGWSSEHQAVLGDRALHHVHAARGAVVVVEAGLLVVEPSQQPRLAVLVPPETQAETAVVVTSHQPVDVHASGGRASERRDLRGLEGASGQQVGELVALGHGRTPTSIGTTIIEAYSTKSSVSIQ
jgi:hypothetical protein